MNIYISKDISEYVGLIYPTYILNGKANNYHISVNIDRFVDSFINLNGCQNIQYNLKIENGPTKYANISEDWVNQVVVWDILMDIEKNKLKFDKLILVQLEYEDDDTTLVSQSELVRYKLLF
jgi:hypothetical protein